MAKKIKQKKMANTKHDYEVYQAAVDEYVTALRLYIEELPQGAVDEGSNPPPPPPPPPPHG